MTATLARGQQINPPFLKVVSVCHGVEFLAVEGRSVSKKKHMPLMRYLNYLAKTPEVLIQQSRNETVLLRDSISCC